MSEEQKEWFANWFDSEYYPLLYQHRDTEEAASFVDHLMQHLNLPATARVADMACGEGRYAVQLSKYVAQVFGFDLSAERIKKAIAHYQNEKVSFYEHDMRTPIHVNYFDAIFNFFTSFGYFDTYRDHLNAAAAMANGLKKGGILVIDYFNAQVVKESLVPSEQIQRGSITFDITRKLTTKKIVKEIKVTDASLSEKLNFEEQVSDVSLNDFVQLFSKVGLTLETTFGDYRLGTFNIEDSPRLIMIFKK